MLEPQYVERTTGRFHAFFVSSRFVLFRKRVMDITAKASIDANILEGICPSCVGLTSSVHPEVQTPNEEANSQTGVSTKNALLTTNTSFSCINSSTEHWYALRTTYGREKKASDYLILKGIKAFYPTITTVKEVSGKRQMLEESRIPNLFFAYGSFDVLKEYVYDNVHEETKHLRFYYRHRHVGANIEKEPLIVPDSQIRSLMIICNSGVDDILLQPFPVEKFQKGQRVVITEGEFKGVEGVVARFQGQQRVGIVIDGLLTMTTAYIPSAFLVKC